MKLAFLMRDNPDTSFNGLSTYARELTKELKLRHEVEWFIGLTDRKTLAMGALIPERFDLIYVLSLPYGAKVRKEFPMVAKVNSPIKEEIKYYSGFKKVKGFYGQYQEISTLNKAKAIISVSQISHDILLKEYSAESIIIPDGVDLEKFKPVSKDDGPSVLMCTRSEPRKNLPLTRRAIEFLQYKAYLYAALGAPSIPQKMLESWFTSANIFLTTSSSEGFNNVLLEAMASGCACLASDIPAHRELIRDGVEGFLFKDEVEMKKNLDLLIESKQLRTMLGGYARKKAENYPWSRTAMETEKVFEDVLSS